MVNQSSYGSASGITTSTRANRHTGSKTRGVASLAAPLRPGSASHQGLTLRGRTALVTHGFFAHCSRLTPSRYSRTARVLSTRLATYSSSRSGSAPYPRMSSFAFAANASHA
jgi:hypothetical protein